MNILIAKKKCGKCGEWKKKSEFGKNKQGKNGLYSLCKQCHNKNTRKWKVANPKKVQENRRKEYARNPKKYLEWLLKWRHANSEKVSWYNHKYYQAHKEKFATTVQNRQAKCNGGKVTSEQWEALKRKYNYTCLRCKRREPEIKLTRDHVLPLELGGKHVIENIQPLCKSCNSWKHTKYIDFRPQY